MDPELPLPHNGHAAFEVKILIFKGARRRARQGACTAQCFRVDEAHPPAGHCHRSSTASLAVDRIRRTPRGSIRVELAKETAPSGVAKIYFLSILIQNSDAEDTFRLSVALDSVSGIRNLTDYAVRSSLIVVGSSGFCSIGPFFIFLASSAFNSAPTSRANPVQYNQIIRATPAPRVP